jgi:glycosyltransferase involved in cell wall biosynthesis
MQTTARRDYAVARAFHAHGALVAMATDLIVPHWARRAARGPFRRYLVGLPPRMVIGAPLSGLAYRAFMRLTRPFTSWPHVWAARRVAELATERFAAASPDVIYGLDTGALELFRAFDESRPRPRLVLEQCVAPRASQLDMVDRLAPFMPAALARHRKANIEVLKAREEEEWRLADLVLAPSDYVAAELVRAGCAEAKIRLVPYGYSPAAGAPERGPFSVEPPLKGLFVGTVDYRKGVHDLAAVAERFRGRLQVDVLGKIMVDGAAAANWGRTLALRGPQPFDAVQAAYARADFLILPSYLEGSAMAVYEAMSFGLPCVVTRETGSVVTDGLDGFVFPAGDRDALTGILERIVSSPSLLPDMSRRAAAAARRVSSEQYGARLLAAVMS